MKALREKYKIHKLEKLEWIPNNYRLQGYRLKDKTVKPAKVGKPADPRVGSKWTLPNDYRLETESVRLATESDPLNMLYDVGVLARSDGAIQPSKPAQLRETTNREQTYKKPKPDKNPKPDSNRKSERAPPKQRAKPKITDRVTRKEMALFIGATPEDEIVRLLGED